jgi:hypothetical protein
MRLFTPELRVASEDDVHLSSTKKAWDCGCRRHLEASGEEALIAKAGAGGVARVEEVGAARRRAPGAGSVRERVS